MKNKEIYRRKNEIRKKDVYEIAIEKYLTVERSENKLIKSQILRRFQIKQKEKM